MSSKVLVEIIANVIAVFLGKALGVLGSAARWNRLSELRIYDSEVVTLAWKKQVIWKWPAGALGITDHQRTGDSQSNEQNGEGV